MTAYLHRVDPRERDKPAPLVLPKDAWCGREFVEADGTVDTVVWNGACRWPPSDCGRRAPCTAETSGKTARASENIGVFDGPVHAGKLQ